MLNIVNNINNSSSKQQKQRHICCHKFITIHFRSSCLQVTLLTRWCKQLKEDKGEIKF